MRQRARCREMRQSSDVSLLTAPGSSVSMRPPRSPRGLRSSSHVPQQRRTSSAEPHGAREATGAGVARLRGMSTTSALRDLIDILDTPRFRSGRAPISFRFFVVLDVDDVATARPDATIADSRRCVAGPSATRQNP